MSSSSDIQKNIDSAITSRTTWNAELMSLNQKLADAKKVTAKAALRKQIRNAEDQIKDLDRLVSRLSNDLQKVARSEDKAEHKNILAAQGKTKLGVFADAAGDVIKEIIPMTAYGQELDTNDTITQTATSLPFEDKKRSTDAGQPPKITLSPELKSKWMLYAALAVLALVLLNRK